MSDVIKFPSNRPTKGITGRDDYIIAEALYLAAKSIDQMPKELRRESDKHDMVRILNTAFPDWEKAFGPF